MPSWPQMDTAATVRQKLAIASSGRPQAVNATRKTVLVAYPENIRTQRERLLARAAVLQRIHSGCRSCAAWQSVQ